VSYNPTAAEETASGPGPWPALITDVDTDGRVDLLVHTPGDALGVGITQLPAALADPLITSADASDLATAITLVNEIKADLNTATTLLNAVREHQLDTRKNAVAQGTTGGTYSLIGEGASTS
jgi:hypothetical protein